MGVLSTIFLLVWVGFSAWSRPPLEIDRDVVVSEVGPEAKQEAFHKAVEEASLKLITDSIGADALEKQSAKIKQILNLSEKYILFIKGSNPETVPEGSKIKVQIKISLDNFEALLRETGLLQSGNHGQKLIPIIDFSDEAGALHYAWWADPASLSGAKIWERFLTSLSARLRSRGLHLADALNIDRVPPALRKRSLNREEQLQLAKLFDSALILLGDVRLNAADDPQKAQIQMELVDAKADHSLGTSQATAGPVKDEAALTAKLADAVNEQIKEAQASGRMNIATFRLVIAGNLSYQALQQLRRELLEQVLDIHTLRDRLYAPGQVVFEAESNRSTAELAKQIHQVHFSQVKVETTDEGANGLVLTVR